MGTCTPQRLRNCFIYGTNGNGKEDYKDMLVVVATLINAVTFSAGVNPPGGVWQDDKAGHKAGRSIYSSQEGPFQIFLLLNTLAFSTSIVLLTSLIYKFPFFIYLWRAIAAMFATYAAAIFAIAPDESVKFQYLLAAGVVPFAVKILHALVLTKRDPDDDPVAVGARTNDHTDLNSDALTA